MRLKVPKGLGFFLESFFHKHLILQRNASPCTIASYRDTILLLLRFTSEEKGISPSNINLEDLDRDMIVEFLNYLEEKRGNSVRSRNIRLAAIRSFMGYVAICDPTKMGITQRIMTIPPKRYNKAIMGYLHNEELNAILKSPDMTTSQGRRDYALLLFLVRTGARVSEAITVNASDFRMNKPASVILHGKGKKDRAIPLSNDLRLTIQNLLSEYGLDTNDKAAIFINTRGQRLSRFGVTHIIGKAVKSASDIIPDLKTKKISPHTFRHTLAMQLLQSGVDLTTIKSWLGHVMLETVHQYVEADIEMKRKALQKCDLPEGKKRTYKASDDILKMLMEI